MLRRASRVGHDVMWATAEAVATGCCAGLALSVSMSGSDGNEKQLPKQDAGAPGGGALA